LKNHSQIPECASGDVLDKNTFATMKGGIGIPPRKSGFVNVETTDCLNREDVAGLRSISEWIKH